MNYYIILAFASILIACGLLMIGCWIWQRVMRTETVIDKYTPGCFVRRADVVEEWED
jgi:hypothetical protein